MADFVLRRRVASGLLILLVLTTPLAMLGNSMPEVQAQADPPRAKYVILLIADGWGIKHIEATNDYAGRVPTYQGWTRYWMSTYAAGGGYDPAQAWSDFDYVNGGVTDSAAAATALYSGVKTDNGKISVSPGGARLTTIGDKARALGKAVGAVTSVWVSHATPAAWYAHNDSRSNGYAIAEEGFLGDPNTTGSYGGGHGPTLPPADVIVGATSTSYVHPLTRNRLSDESGDPGKHVLVERIAGSPDGGPRLLAAAHDPGTTKLAGLFDQVYQLADGSGYNPENPTLADMTNAAFAVLSRNPNGFVLLVEGGAVDWAAHVNDMNRMIGEQLDFDRAVQAVIDWVEDAGNGSNWENTLVIVTGDHETGHLTGGLGVFPDQPLGEVSDVTLAKEKPILSTVRRASWEDLDEDSAIDAGEEVYWVWNSGSHTNSLIPLYTRGAGSELFAAYVDGTDPVRGVYIDNADVFRVTDAVLAAATDVPLSSIVINEVDADAAGSDTLEFIELYDGGTGNADLSGLVVVLWNGSDDASYQAFDLDGYVTDANGYVVLGNAAVPNVDLVFADDTLQDGAAAVAVYVGDATDFPAGTPITTANLLDALVYDTDDADQAGLLILLNGGEPQVNEAGGGNQAGHSNQRCPNGSGGQRNTSNYVQISPSPGEGNRCCGTDASLIHVVQGSGLSSPMVGMSGVSIEGVVVGDFQDTDLQGFYVQEEDSDADVDPATSEGIFVRSTAVDVSEGDLVRVEGDVVESNGLTGLEDVDTVLVCSSSHGATAAVVYLPFPSDTHLERYEGMLVQLPQTLTVSGNHNLGRFGEVVLSYGRLMQPTHVIAPGADASELQAANDLNRILLDDGSAVQNPDPILQPSPELSATHTLRGGDTVTDVRGVLSYGGSGYSGTDNYRVHPVTTPLFVTTNPRTSEPAWVGGRLKVASFDTQGYFNGDGLGGGFPTSHGASSLLEFNRQRAKIISAVLAMDADIVGLTEIENDGYGPDSAIQDLVSGLNASAPLSTTYAFVSPGFALGADEIKVGLLYRTETITPTDIAATTTTTPFVAYRSPLAQTFEERATSERFTVVVGDFKSKSCTGASGADADQGDGQGCYNATRTQMAKVLTDWLAADPTGSGDADFLIVGGLNAYRFEDPITAITDAGHKELVAAFAAPDTYSYVCDGQAGYTDHALGTESLGEQVTGVTIWHINADEPNVLDYKQEYKSAGQLTSLYSPDGYRSSDHDPVIVGLVPGGLQSKVYLPLLVR